MLTCAWWLAAELRLVSPKLVVASGATALHSLFGRNAKVKHDRGTVLKTGNGLYVLVTIHPSACCERCGSPTPSASVASSSKT